MDWNQVTRTPRLLHPRCRLLLKILHVNPAMPSYSDGPEAGGNRLKDVLLGCLIKGSHPFLPHSFPAHRHQSIEHVQKQKGSHSKLESSAQKLSGIPWARMFHCMTLMGGWLLGQSVLRSTKSLWNRGGRVCRTALHSSRSSLGSMGSRCSGSGDTKYSGC